MLLWKFTVHYVQSQTGEFELVRIRRSRTTCSRVWGVLTGGGGHSAHSLVWCHHWADGQAALSLSSAGVALPPSATRRRPSPENWSGCPGAPVWSLSISKERTHTERAHTHTHTEFVQACQLCPTHWWSLLPSGWRPCRHPFWGSWLSGGACGSAAVLLDLLLRLWNHRKQLHC